MQAEKELTRKSDELAERRQKLPWVPVEKDYRFETDKGTAKLADLFGGRSQLLVYHFMFGPEYTGGCPSCSMIADGFDGFSVHLAQHDVMLWAVSRAPFEKLQGYKERMGWSFPWASSAKSDFNADFSVWFTEEQQNGGGIRVQLPTGSRSASVATAGGRRGRSPRCAASIRRPTSRERPGMSAFKMQDGAVHHAYSTYARGLEGLWGAYQWRDRAPTGRNETNLWWKRHDEYDAGLNEDGPAGADAGAGGASRVHPRVGSLRCGAVGSRASLRDAPQVLGCPLRVPRLHDPRGLRLHRRLQHHARRFVVRFLQREQLEQRRLEQWEAPAAARAAEPRRHPAEAQMNPPDGPPAGNPGASSPVPAAGQAEDVSNPTTVIGIGSAASCTGDAVVAAVARGGVITFDCGPDPVTIVLTSTAKVFNNTAPKLVIDGGNKVTLSGGGKIRILYMSTCDAAQVYPSGPGDCNTNAGVQLVVQNITFVDGNSTGIPDGNDNAGGGGAGLRAGREPQGGPCAVLLRNVCADLGSDLGGGAIRKLDYLIAPGLGPSRPVWVVNSTFGGGATYGNSCANGGALSSIGVSWNIINTLLSDSTAVGHGANSGQGGNGGAIYNDGDEIVLDVTGSLIENNMANEGGSAVFFVSNDMTGSITIKDSTTMNNPRGTFETPNLPGFYVIAMQAAQIINSQDPALIPIQSVRRTAASRLRRRARPSRARVAPSHEKYAPCAESSGALPCAKSSECGNCLPPRHQLVVTVGRPGAASTLEGKT